MGPPIEFVIFDCDGTLVDSEPVVAEVLAECAREHGIAISADEAFFRFRGGRMADCVKVLEQIKGKPLPASFVDDVRARQAVALEQRLQPMKGAVELLSAMHLPFCMASNGPREKMQVTLAVTGLMPFFEGRIFSAYEVGSWKPAPALFLHAARASAVPPEHCAVIEDSLPGVEAGLAAGMQVFALQEPGIEERMPPGVTIVQELRELHHHLLLPERQGAPGAGRQTVHAL